MLHTAVIADDITGANDIGIMYYKAGCTSTVYSFEQFDGTTITADRDTVIMDTNSRFLSPQEAYDRVFKAVGYFKNAGVCQYYNKQCSVFRGNIGAEFDAMLDALGESFAVVVLGFPDNGRTTTHGRHYVYGTLLENSQFRHDPVHPMTCSRLDQILKSQTQRTVTSIYMETLDQGPEALKREIDRQRALTNYCIIDVRDNRDLEIIAAAVREEKIICGSSALGYYLGLLRNGHQRKGARSVAATARQTADYTGSPQMAPQATGCTSSALTALPTADCMSPPMTAPPSPRVLCLAGSLTAQTRAQTAHMRTHGYPVLCLDTTQLFALDNACREKQRILTQCRRLFADHDFVMVHAMQAEDQVALTKSLGAAHGLSNTEVSRIVSETLAELASQISADHGIHHFIICGGDTSAAFCRRFGIAAMDIGPEIEPGVPVCIHNDAPHERLVLKSGSFGSAAFIEKAVQQLNREMTP